MPSYPDIAKVVCAEADTFLNTYPLGLKMSTISVISIRPQPVSNTSTAVPASTGNSLKPLLTPSSDSHPAGVKVSLSVEGLTKAAERKSTVSNKDIEESGLPDKAQKILKAIRDLQKQIADKQAEMQALMADQNMDPEAKRVKVGVLQTTIATLSASLTAASASLDKMTKNGTLTPAETQKAAKLLMAKSD